MNTENVSEVVVEPVIETVIETLAAVQSPGKVKRKYVHKNRLKDTIAAKRVVLHNGVPAKKGRTPNNGSINKTVVYIGMDEVYNFDKHGIGEPFNPLQHPQLSRISISPVVS